jgi:hypothetical protein
MAGGGAKPGQRRGGRKPGSRNKATRDFQALVNSYAEPAISVLVEVMNDKEAPHAARANAANSLLRKSIPDLQSTKVTGSDDGPLIIQVVKFADAKNT